MREMNDVLKQLIRSLSGRRVLVIGDLVADEYIYGRTARISREAPVLILKFVSRTVLPGGAGNAIMNVRSLGADPVPLGVVGDDEMGEALRTAFRNQGIDCSGMITISQRSTTVKTRILAGSLHTTRQQVIRVDKEEMGPLLKPVSKQLLERFEKLLPGVDAVLVSDYGYGVVGEEIKQRVGAGHDRPVVVDSRYDLLSFKRITIATPNEEEVIGVLDKTIETATELEVAGKELLHRLDCPALLVTRGSLGMSLFQRDGSIVHIPVSGTDEIADVTGAGDTVAAVMATALAAGADFLTATHLANIAGGIVVMKRGTGIVHPEELIAVLEEDSP